MFLWGHSSHANYHNAWTSVECCVTRPHRSIHLFSSSTGPQQVLSFAVQNAFKCYVRTRDYCSTSVHILSMCLNVIKASLEPSLGNYLNVQASTYRLQPRP